MEQGWLGLEGQVLIVTGGASGIGKHVADTLTAAGANAVIVDMMYRPDSCWTALTVCSAT